MAGKKSFSTIDIPFDSQYTSVSDTEGSSLVFRKCVIYLIDCMCWVEYVNQIINFIYSLDQSLYESLDGGGGSGIHYSLKI